MFVREEVFDDKESEFTDVGFVFGNIFDRVIIMYRCIMSENERICDERFRNMYRSSPILELCKR
jgi:hypothetical protein